MRTTETARSDYRLSAMEAIARITRRSHLPGTERLLGLIQLPIRRQRLHFEVLMPYDADLLIQIDSSSFIERALFFRGHYEPEISRLLKRLIRPGFVVVDVGANIGCHTLIMSLMAEATGKVIAVEPHPVIYQRLVGNIALNRLKNISPIRCALSDSSGCSTLYSFQAGASNQGVSSFHAANVGAQPVEIPVEVRRLDEVMQDGDEARLDLIKVDTEGHELKVLLGGEESIQRYRPLIIFEYEERTWKNSGCDFALARTFLLDHGYTAYTIGSRCLSKLGTDLQMSTNVLAVPSTLA